MLSVARQSFFWQYLSEGQKGLIEEGLRLVADACARPNPDIADYSYLVFPFAKAYEGFLKQLFLDLRFITEREYESHKFRIGKALNPYLERHLRHHQSVYDKLLRYCGSEELADRIWDAWKIGRNEVFHYFPHNVHALTLLEAEAIITKLLEVMEEAVTQCKMRSKITTPMAFHPS